MFSLNKKQNNMSDTDNNKRNNTDHATDKEESSSLNNARSISLPKGGGAIKGIGEKFTANPVTGTGSVSVPIFTSPGRSGFGPQLSLSYDSGSGNGPFGFGWNLSLPSITRKTDKGLPKYQDNADELEEDVFILSGAEDLVPVFRKDQNGEWMHDEEGNYILEEEERDGYDVRQYRPRIEGLFARIERWTHKATGAVHWRSISKDNILTVYGKDEHSRIADPVADDESNHRRRIFSWLICQSYDDKGNAILYEYAEEDEKALDLSQANERNRVRTANRYIKRILYGNRQPLLLDITKPSFRKSHIEQTEEDFSSADWMFEVVFDYGEDHYKMLPLDSSRPEDEQHQLLEASSASSQGSAWSSRPDPFSTYRAGFEVRTYRRCQRVLMFHRFPELGREPYLVRSTDFDYSDFDYSSQQQSDDILVKNELEHKGSTRFASFIQAVVQSGYVRDEARPVNVVNGVKYLTYLKKSLPPLEFEYSKATINEEIRELDDVSLENLPYGLDNTNYQFVDLDGESISGILTEQAGAWFYKPNLGGGKFGPVQEVAAKPSLADLNSGRQQLLDLAGDGQLDIVQLDGPVAGFYERSKEDEKNWENFTPFASLPNIAWKDPSLRFVDLTGDGHADVLITEDNAFSWYPSMAEEGFGSAQKVHQALEEEKGPRLVFGDGTQSIYLADMSGDGLTDLVRIRNGEVCYWPNLGYGRFGAKVTMDNAPWFDVYDIFDQKRIRLADVDGTGVTDIIYLGRRNGVQIYFNQSGNRWSDAYTISNFPHVDNLSSSIQAMDLLGTGTACLVWSSSLPGNFRRQMRYIDLMSRQKPYLLIGSKNNLGEQTRVHYVTSTKFYLVDKVKGKPWITRMPFPVHVVERVETYDWISRNRFVTRYAYHHGYFDGIEREFRGFGRVDQLDTEEIGTATSSDLIASESESVNWDAASFVPPVLTCTWFHTGAYHDDGRISKQFEEEYYHEGDPGLGEGELSPEKLQAMLLSDTELPEDDDDDDEPLTSEEAREACRALKGSILRQEIYALDSHIGLLQQTPNEESDRPYTVSECNYTIKRLQPRGNNNKYAVFFVHPRETVDFHYERKLYDVNVASGQTEKRADPRVTHNVTLEVDEYGNETKSIAIGYGRRYSDPNLSLQDQEKQRLIYISCRENTFTNAVVDEADAYRTPLLAETCTYELRKPQQEKSGNEPTKLYQFNALLSDVDQARDGKHDINYEDIEFTRAKDATTNNAEEGTKYFRRLIEQMRLLYRSKKLDSLLLLGEVDSLALPGETYKLAFTRGLLDSVYQRELTGEPSKSLIPDPTSVLGSKNPDGGGYVDLDEDGNWWIPSGQVFYWQQDLEDDPQQELDFASKHFFLPHRFRDPFGKNSIVAYDSSEADPKKNHNLLVVQTHDPLGNSLLAENNYRVLQPTRVTDPNGTVSEALFDTLGLTVSTAIHKNDLGDSLQGENIQADLTRKQLDDFFADPRGQAITRLSTATTYIIYDIGRYYLTGDPDKPAYVALIARETHVSDPVPEGGLKTQISFTYSDGSSREIQKKIQAEEGPINEIYTDSRWVGSGWTIFNNKGKPVRKYEPFFDDTHEFRFGKKEGVSSTLFYDPVERVVATLHPNDTYEKVVFDPWHQITYDVNDTTQLDARTDEDVHDYVTKYFAIQQANWQTWYQQRISGDPEDEDFKAAQKTEAHAETPSTAYFDTLGRTFLTIADNGKDENDKDVLYKTRVVLDIEGNERDVIDAKERVVMRIEYNMMGNRIKQASMEAGTRWMLSSVNGKPICSWDSRGFMRRMTYDALQRPLELIVTKEGITGKFLAEKISYGESKPNPETTNHRLKTWEVRDGAGVLVNEYYDFKGNLVQGRRKLLSDYKTHIVDWAQSSQLEEETFTSYTLYDALNRPIQTVAPHSSRAGTKLNVTQPVYNEANLLERIDVWLEQDSEPNGLLNPDTATQHFVKNIDYNAKGQRKYIEYGMKDGNRVWTSYEYDEKTFRLVHLQTRRLRSGHSDEEELLQDLFYIYDPVGNIMHILDNAQQELFVKGRWVEPSTDYIYDPIYRLLEAMGREHLGKGSANAPEPTSPTDDPRVGLNLNDPNFLGTYLEEYGYDPVGNIEHVKHTGTDPSNPGWTRFYNYNEESQIEAGKKCNRLSSTVVSGITYSYKHDVHGNVTIMPHFDHQDPNKSNMHWDFKDQLQKVNLDGGGTAYYVYDTVGQRVRKVLERSPGLIEERIYLGDFEIFRRRSGAGIPLILQRETLHIMDDKQRIALIETRNQGSEPGVPAQLILYQLGNHLSSASLELDEQAEIISYEEYFPYGSTAYQAVRSQIKVNLKHYRYTGKERDEESGLYYHGARYYAAWLGRWTNCDPAGLIDGVNVYAYVKNNSVRMSDVLGLKGEDPNEPAKGGSEHTKDARPSTKDKHERGTSRKERDQQRADERRRKEDRARRRRNPKGESEAEKRKRENREKKERYKKEGEKERDPERERKEHERREREKRWKEQERKEQERRRLEEVDKPLEKPSLAAEVYGIIVLAAGVFILMRGAKGPAPSGPQPGPGPVLQPAF